MKVLKSIKTICVALLVIMISGCDSWLDLKPIDKVLEDQLYETEEGFKQSLTGVYVELNQRNLYGGDLMFRMVEILAQRYNLSSIGTYKEWVAYNYSDDDVKSSIDGLWQKMYALIMNCNKLIEIYIGSWSINLYESFELKNLLSLISIQLDDYALMFCHAIVFESMNH